MTQLVIQNLPNIYLSTYLSKTFHKYAGVKKLARQKLKIFQAARRRNTCGQLCSGPPHMWTLLALNQQELNTRYSLKYFGQKSLQIQKCQVSEFTSLIFDSSELLASFSLMTPPRPPHHQLCSSWSSFQTTQLADADILLLSIYPHYHHAQAHQSHFM